MTHTDESELSTVERTLCSLDSDLTIAQSYVKASNFSTQEADGLSQPWSGRVFVNPPFGASNGKSVQGGFLTNASSEFRSGRASEVLLLLKAASGYAWFQEVLQQPNNFLSKRVACHNPAQGSSSVVPSSADPHGSVVVYLGPHLAQFYQVFANLAAIPGHNSWACQQEP